MHLKIGMVLFARLSGGERGFKELKLSRENKSAQTATYNNCAILCCREISNATKLSYESIDRALKRV